ncbi:26947_t:CDS:2 [Dentiscutata erythropus]|uniref:26947_t:CDS:1 n=1 Tax=Dentiscutata erythropus TaxID=1348616 RepID=A0A9N9G5E7_9GLOM|nr:26947_t:CDS:2 [Dentiscutata erythropus]
MQKAAVKKKHNQKENPQEAAVKKKRGQPKKALEESLTEDQNDNSNSEFIQGCTGPKSEFHVYGIKQQIKMFIAANTKSNKSKKAKKINDFSRTLFSVYGAGNDFVFSGMSASPLEVVQSLIDALHLLVKSFPTINTILMPNIQDLSQLPIYKTSNIEEKARISKLVESHNKYLLEHLVKFNRETDVKIIYLKN